jgi:Toprim domain
MYYSRTPSAKWCKQTCVCQVCGNPFASPDKARGFCSPDCLRARAPVVYRYICPDGRSYVGSVSDSRNRFNDGIARSNSRLIAACAKYPPQTWTYEILEELRPGCSVRELREAEQRYMELFASLARGNKAAKLRAIREALRTAKRVWLATDCDREGQLIGQEILEHYEYPSS